MLKEIHEQPTVIQNFLEYYLDNLELIPDISLYEKIHIVACVALIMLDLLVLSLIEKYGDIEVEVFIASEYRYKKNFLNENTLVIFISQSGETADTIACLRLAKSYQAKTLGIVNVVGSTIARKPIMYLILCQGCEIAVATTKAYTLQSLND